MDRNIILGVTGLVVALLSLALLLPDKSTSTGDTLPWHISHPTPDTTKVLGITLGSTTLGEAEQSFQEASEVSLFKPTEGNYAIEAYFDEVKLNGLKAKIVVTMALPQETLQGMFERGLRMNATGSGKRITLAPDDLAKVRQSPLASLSYLPTVQLEEAVLTKRFGTPAERIREKKSGAMHWLYPQHGLDITLGNGEKPLLQYVTPKNFDQLRAPLLANGEIQQ